MRAYTVTSVVAKVMARRCTYCKTMTRDYAFGHGAWFCRDPFACQDRIDSARTKGVK